MSNYNIVARRTAVELLRQVFSDKANTIEGELPAFVVCNNALVTPVALRTIADSATSCPKCARIYVDEDGTPPEYLLVDVSIRIPVAILPDKSSNVDTPTDIDLSVDSIAEMLAID